MLEEVLAVGPLTARSLEARYLLGIAGAGEQRKS